MGLFVLYCVSPWFQRCRESSVVLLIELEFNLIILSKCALFDLEWVTEE